MGKHGDREGVRWQSPRVKDVFGLGGDLSDRLCVYDRGPSLVRSHNAVPNLSLPDFFLFSTFFIKFPPTLLAGVGEISDGCAIRNHNISPVHMYFS